MQFMFDCPSDDGIHGIVEFGAVIDLDVMSVKQFVNMASRIANLQGYNYVNHTILVNNTCITHKGKSYQCGSVSIQFEASYVDGTSLIVGSSVYHVTTKNAARKILA